MRPYEPVNINQWGKSVDYNIFTDALSLQTSREKYGQDVHSCLIPLQFSDPHQGDYSIRIGLSESRQAGFQQFPIDNFGVQSKRLRVLACKPQFSLPVPVSATAHAEDYVEWHGLRLQNIDNAGLQSATGMYAMTGVYVMAVVDQYALLSRHIYSGDVIIAVNGREVKTTTDLLASDTITTLTVFRNQKKKEINI